MLSRILKIALLCGLIAASGVHAQMAAPSVSTAGAPGTGTAPLGSAADLSALKAMSMDAAVKPASITNMRGPSQSAPRGKAGAEIEGDKDSTRPVVTAAPRGLNEFQKFVAEATGAVLPIHGADFFASSRGYAAMQGTPVPSDYRLGPGDEIVIRGWGSVDIDFRDVVDRNGLVHVPKVGAVMLAGVRAGDAEGAVRAAFDKYFRGYSLNVTLGQLRGMTVYVVGQAQSPGTYTVSSLSTVITALFQSGGPGPNGSLRRVQVKRAGQQVAELDLYAFIARGDKSADIRLLDGDVIVIPPAHGFVALAGKVETPAIYELKGPEDTLKGLIELAGGLPVVANPHRAFIERIDPVRSMQPRSVADISLDATGLAYKLRNGDLITVLPIRSTFDNAVALRGVIDAPLRLPYREGMRITDLIPDKNFLLSRSVIQRQNNLLDVQRGKAATAGIGNRYDVINWDYAVVERLNPAELTETLIPFNLGRALADPKSPDNVPLRVGDTVTLFSADDVRVPVAKRRVYVRVEGEVRRPGIYQVEPGESLINILERAGSLTPDAYLFGAEFTRESVRQSQQDNLEKLTRRIEQQMFSETSRLAANTTADAQSAALMQARMAAEAEARNRFVQRLRELKSNGRVALGVPFAQAGLAQLPAMRLENGDRLFVPPRPDFIQVAGAIGTESALLWQPGRSVSDYLAQAGLSRDSDKDGIFVMRADGTVISGADRWLTSIAGVEALPGDVVVVPEKLDKETFWPTFMRYAKDITQVLSNLGLGAAAIHTLSK